jgi:hypothetical protein
MNMIVYNVFPDNANKKRFVTTLDPLDHISGKVESRIEEFDCTVEKKAARWNPPAIVWFDDDGRKLNKYKDPDISYIFLGSYILSPHAAELLRPVVSDVAELLPIPFQGETWYFMNVFNRIDAIDKAKSRYKIYSSGRVGPVEKIVFSPEKLPHAKLFTIPESPARLLYAEHHPDPNPHTFKNIVEQNKLFGIVIEKMWEN